MAGANKQEDPPDIDFPCPLTFKVWWDEVMDWLLDNRVLDDGGETTQTTDSQGGKGKVMSVVPSQGTPVTFYSASRNGATVSVTIPNATIVKQPQSGGGGNG